LERSSYNDKQEGKWRRNPSLFPQEVSGMAYWNVARMLQEEKRILEAGLR
jgi:hypothetical protein